MSKIGLRPDVVFADLPCRTNDQQARDLLVKWLKEIKLAVTIDEMGNIFARDLEKVKI